MQTFASPNKITAAGTLRIGREKFVVLKKEYIDELLTLLKSAAQGEQMLRAGRTRSFGEFVRSAARKK